MDDLSINALLGILLLLVVLGAWFSAAETSMMAINRYRLNHLIRKGNRSAKLTGRLLSKVDKLLGSILFGNTLLNVAAAAITNILILRLFGASELAILFGTLAITFVLLVFSEIMPKIIAATYPERVALPSSYLLAPLITLFHPVVSVATGLVRASSCCCASTSRPTRANTRSRWRNSVDWCWRLSISCRASTRRCC